MSVAEAQLAVTEAERVCRTAARAIQDARNPSAAELTRLERAFDDANWQVTQAKARLALADDGQSRGATSSTSDVRVTSEPSIYHRHGPHSYFADLARGMKGDSESQSRLERYAREAAQKRAINSADGTGGYFVPPAWLQEQWVKLARAGRPLADAVNSMPLPKGTDSINVPKLATGAAVAAQQDNTTVQSTDATDTSVVAPVITIAGQQDVSRQLLERSGQAGAAIDTVISQDLLASYNTQIDTQLISGSGTSGNATGLLSNASRTITTFTSASPTVALLYSKLAGAIQSMHTSRFLPPTLIAMHPRRWAWILASLDSNNRPLVVPNAQGPFNAIGTFERVASENLVGNLQGLPVIVDASIPTNRGAGTNEDVIFILRTPDIWLMEDTDGPFTKVFEQTLAGTLTIKLQLYNYAAILGNRYNASVGTIEGTGLTAVSF